MNPMNTSKRAKLDLSGRKGDVSVDKDAAMARISNLLEMDADDIDGKNGNADWFDEFRDVDWRRAFTNQGHLRLPILMKMFPPLDYDGPDSASVKLGYNYRNLKNATIGLLHFNRNHKEAQYDLVRPIGSQPSMAGAYLSYHCNFLAKPKNDFNAPTELFYTDIDTRGTVDEAVVSTILPPSLYPPGIATPLEKAELSCRVIHPVEVKCYWCNGIDSDYESDSEDD